jgi:hypothetical protein
MTRSVTLVAASWAILALAEVVNGRPSLVLMTLAAFIFAIALIDLTIAVLDRVGSWWHTRWAVEIIAGARCKGALPGLLSERTEPGRGHVRTLSEDQVVFDYEVSA